MVANYTELGLIHIDGPRSHFKINASLISQSKLILEMYEHGVPSTWADIHLPIQGCRDSRLQREQKVRSAEDKENMLLRVHSHRDGILS